MNGRKRNNSVKTPPIIIEGADEKLTAHVLKGLKKIKQKEYAIKVITDFANANKPIPYNIIRSNALLIR